MTSLFEEEITLFADLILPVPIPNLFTYRVPREMASLIKVGARVIVQFGQKRVITAVVAQLHSNPPVKYQAKYILELLDDQPIVTQQQLELFAWVAEYYLCNIGEVMNVALPAGLKITSQSRIQLNPEFEYEELLTDQEILVIEEIKKHQTLSYEEVERLLQKSNITSIIKSLVGKRAVILLSLIHI